ncbi:MAG: hypothetical protein ABJ364_14725 [Lentilitoribacter sp.]
MRKIAKKRSAFAPGSFDVLLTQSGADTHITKSLHGEDLLGIIESFSKTRSQIQEFEHSISGEG